MTNFISSSQLPSGPSSRSPSVPEIRNAVERILSQPEFQNSKRLRAFLRFVTDTTLEGRGETLKAVAIAIAVFGRDETFDAHANPLVRVEATRLRKALRSYYEQRGENDVVEISLPVGSYVPIFKYRIVKTSDPDLTALHPSEQGTTSESRDDLMPPVKARPAWYLPMGVGAIVATITFAGVLGLLNLIQGSLFQPASVEPSARASIIVADVPELRPSLTIRSFEVAGQSPLAFATTGSLELDFLQALGRFDDLLVRNGFSNVGATRSSFQPSDYELDGRLETEPPSLTLRVRRSDNSEIWSHRFPLRSFDLERKERADLVRSVVSSLAHPLGVLDDDIQLRARSGKPLSAGLECYSHMIEFEARGEDPARRAAHACLTGILSSGGDQILPSLLLAELQARSFVSNAPRLSTEAPLDAAESMTMRAISAGPERALAYSTLAYVLHLRGRKEEAREIGRRALEINPNEATAMAVVGAMEIVGGDRSAGAAMLRQVQVEHPRFPSWIRFFRFLEAFERGDVKGQLQIIAPGDHPEGPLSVLARAIAEAGAGNMKNAREAVARLKSADPWLAADPVGAFERLQLDPVLIRKLAAGVQAAGL